MTEKIEWVAAEERLPEKKEGGVDVLFQLKDREVLAGRFSTDGRFYVDDLDYPTEEVEIWTMMPKGLPEYWEAKLTYFKPVSGKYYTDHPYRSYKMHIFEIVAEVREMLKEGIRPGLSLCKPGENKYTVLVEVPGHPNNVPTTLFPEER